MIKAIEKGFTINHGVEFYYNAWKSYDDTQYNEDYFDTEIENLQDEEINYLAILLLICSIPLDKSINWLNSPTGQSALLNGTLGYDFFNSIDNEITTAVTANFSEVSQLLEDSFLIGANKGFNLLGKPLVSGVVDKLTLHYIKHYNFDLIRNLTEDLKSSVRETLWRGISEGKTLDEITIDIEKLGLEPLKNGSNAQARAASIARTELTRARVAGQLQAFKYYGIEKANIVPIDDGNECELCLDLIAGNPWTLEQLAILLPVHPNCRHDELEPVIEEDLFNPIMDVDPIDTTIYLMKKLGFLAVA